MLKDEVQKFFKGEVWDDEETLRRYSKDASLFEVKPKLVVWPKDSEDLESLVKWVSSHPGESITIRAAGSDMSGGPLNESIIADVTKYMNKIGRVERETVVEPGAFYRDFEKKTLERGLILPCYTASKNICALGGMIGNNCAGEKTLRFGKMENYVLETKAIFADGKEYTVKPLTIDELNQKILQGDFEGKLYADLYNLIEENKEAIEKARPRVSKNSAGYFLWNVWNGAIFDLNKLLVGSQGTLGIITEAKIKLVPVEPVSRLCVIFLKDLTPIANLVNEVLPSKPTSMEVYDDASMKLAIKYLHRYLFRFLPEALMILRGGLPKMAVIVEYTGSTEKEVHDKMDALKKRIEHMRLPIRLAKTEKDSEKYWAIRRDSFRLLREHIKGARTAPFVDDVVVNPSDMPKFLPEMKQILDETGVVYTIAGHAGNGNFHIIPLMNMHDKRNVEVIREVGEKVYDLVGKFGGSISGEHNDGIVRTPYLGKMYPPHILELFKKTKAIFDPQNIFNPGKKVPSTGLGQAGSIDYMLSHIATE
jgi:FAD/FMN-containing dehydrogenase